MESAQPPISPVLIGDGIADDTLALQQALDRCLIAGRPLLLPTGVYRITKTLLLTDPLQVVFPVTANGYRQIYGAAITGMGSPNERGTAHSGVAIVLDNPAETAVLRMGEGVLYDTVITGVAFLTKSGSGQTTLDIPFTRWSRLRFQHCVLTGCDYAVDLHSANLDGDGNGEMLLFNNCVVSGNLTAYKNTNGMAVCHGFTDCEAGCGPGGTLFTMGNGMYGIDFAAEHIMISCDDLGPKPNTLFNLSDVEMVRFGGGRCRLEFIDTVIRYNGGTLASRGIVVIDDVNFASMPGRGPLIDGTGFTSGMGQMKLTFRDCNFVGKDMSTGRKGGAEGPVVLTVAYHPEDTSRWYFEGCVFNNFSNIHSLLTCPLVEFGPGNFFCPDPSTSWQDQPLTKDLIGKYASTSPLTLPGENKTMDQNTFMDAVPPIAAIPAPSVMPIFEMHCIECGGQSAASLMVTGQIIPGAVRYELDRDSTSIASALTSPHFSDMPLVSGTSYRYTFSAFNSAGSLIGISASTVAVAPYPLLPPTNLCIKAPYTVPIHSDPQFDGASANVMTWTPAKGGFRHNVYASEICVAKNITGNTHTYALADANGGAIYTVTSVDPAGNESAPSAPSYYLYSHLVDDTAVIPPPRHPLFFPQWHNGAPRNVIEWYGPDSSVTFTMSRNGVVVADSLGQPYYIDDNLLPGATDTYSIVSVNPHNGNTPTSIPIVITGTALSAAPARLLGKVEISKIVPGDDSALLFITPLAGATDYRAYNVAKPNVVKYAGEITLDSDQYNNPATNNPRMALSLDFRGIDGSADIVVEAVDRYGPAYPMELILRPDVAMGIMDSGLAINGQRDPSSIPIVLATSDVLHIQTIPMATLAGQVFAETWQDSKPFSPLPLPVVIPPNAQYYGSPHDYASAANDKWEQRQFGCDLTHSKMFVDDGHLHSLIYDGGGPGSPNPPHNNVASQVLMPKTVVDISGGKIAYFTMTADLHHSDRRWLEVGVGAAGDELVNIAKFESHDLSPTAGSGRFVRWQILGQVHSLNWYPNIGGVYSQVNLVQPTDYSDGATLRRKIDGDQMPLSNGTPQDLDKQSRIHFYLSQNAYQIIEETPSGQYSVRRQKSFPAGQEMTMEKLQFYIVWQFYHSANEINELSTYLPSERPWTTFRQYCDLRHSDNVQIAIVDSFDFPPKLASVITPPIIAHPIIAPPFNIRLKPSWTAETGPGDWIDCDLTGTNGDTLCLYINGGLGNGGKPVTEFSRTALPYLFHGPLWGQDGSAFSNGNLYTLTLKDTDCGCESIPSSYARAIGGRAPGNIPGFAYHEAPDVPVNLVATAEWNGDVNGGPGYSRVILTWDSLFNAKQTAGLYNVYKNNVLLLAGITVLRAFDTHATSADVYTVTGVNAYYPGTLESAQSAPASCTVLTGPPAAVSGWAGITDWRGCDDSGWATIAETTALSPNYDVAVYKGTNILSLKGAGTQSMGARPFSDKRHPLAIEVKGLSKSTPETITAVLLDKLLPYVPDTGQMLAGQMSMLDKLPRTWTNGQGDPSNVPNVLATSAPFQTTLVPVVAQPGDYLKTGDDYALGPVLPLPVVTLGLPSGTPPYYGHGNDYSRQEGADVIFEQFGSALEQTVLFGMNGHGMALVKDGGGKLSSNPPNTNNAAGVIRPKDKNTGLPFAAPLKTGAALSFKLLSDAHNDGRGRMRLLFYPAGDTLINPGKFAINENSNNYATLSGTCLAVTVSEAITVEYFEGGNRHDLFNPVSAPGENVFTDSVLLHRAGDWCPQPEINGSPNEIDKGHLFEFVFSEGRYRITESTHDGMVMTREKDIVGVTLPLIDWQCAVSYEPYHTDLERVELLLYRPYERHWINNVPYSRLWHFDNLQFGQRSLAEVGFPKIVPPVVITPPIIVPPIVVEPAHPPVVPPVVVPPVIGPLPPVIVPPVVTPPVVTPPVIVPPAAMSIAEAMTQLSIAVTAEIESLKAQIAALGIHSN